MSLTLGGRLFIIQCHNQPDSWWSGSGGARAETIGGEVCVGRGDADNAPGGRMTTIHIIGMVILAWWALLRWGGEGRCHSRHRGCSFA